MKALPVMVAVNQLKRFSFLALCVVSIAIANSMQEVQAVPFFDGKTGDKTLVLLHAGSGNNQLWEKQFDFFAKNNVRVIAIEHKKLPREKKVEMIHAQLQALNLHSFHLLGTAAGGGVAMDYALAYSEQIKTLIVSNSIGNIRDAEYSEIASRYRPRDIFSSLPVDFLELGPSYRAACPKGTARWIALTGDVHLSPPPKTEQRAKATWADLADLSMPILLMTGDADLYTPPSVLAYFQQKIPKAKTYIFHNSGHSAFWERPLEFNRVVLGFINGEAPGPGLKNSFNCT